MTDSCEYCGRPNLDCYVKPCLNARFRSELESFKIDKMNACNNPAFTEGKQWPSQSAPNVRNSEAKNTVIGPEKPLDISIDSLYNGVIGDTIRKARGPVTDRTIAPCVTDALLYSKGMLTGVGFGLPLSLYGRKGLPIASYLNSLKFVNKNGGEEMTKGQFAYKKLRLTIEYLEAKLQKYFKSNGVEYVIVGDLIFMSGHCEMKIGACGEFWTLGQIVNEERVRKAFIKNSVAIRAFTDLVDNDVDEQLFKAANVIRE